MSATGAAAGSGAEQTPARSAPKVTVEENVEGVWVSRGPIRFDTPLLAATKQVEALRQLRKLHQVEKRYQASLDDEWSFDTPEEAADNGEIDVSQVVFFEVCGHCGDLEMRGAEGLSYLESLWPCATARVIALVQP